MGVLAGRGTAGERGADRGFTLFELLVALAIASLIMALVVPVLMRGPGRRELDASARDVASSLRTTRALAISVDRPEGFVVDVDHGIYGPSARRPLHRLPRGVGISLTTTAGQVYDAATGTVSFFPDGSSTGGEVVLVGDGLRYHVLINWLDGQVTISGTGSAGR
jgi:general secretion pathway protein H